MNLQENIKRIKEVMGINNSNNLIPVETNRFVYHKSNPIFREQIESGGLVTKGKSETWLSDTQIEGDVIFATNSDNQNDWFDSQYDDDIYQIDTTKIDNLWYNDPNFSFNDDNTHIITFKNIPKKAIKLIYRGTGENLDNMNVNEDLHNTFWENDEGDKITLIDLLDFTQDVPIKEISVDDLKQHLLTWDGNNDEIDKIEKSNLEYPILIFVNDNGKLISIIDGHHRIHKALKMGLEKISAKLISINSLPNHIRKVFSHIN